MSISTTTDNLSSIASFLDKPVTGVSKQFEFAQLASDHILLRELKGMNLPLFSFLNQRDITPINPTQGIGLESERSNAIFRDIHVAAKNNLTAAQFNQICARNGTRTLSRYIQLSVAHQANQDHAVTVLADTLRDKIPAIPNTLVAIRVWFANPANQEALQEITQLNMNEKQLKCLPEEIRQLVNLEHLFLAHNQLTTLPGVFGNLMELKGLYLCNNQFSDFPIETLNLTNLTSLSLAHNQLTTLPDSIGKLVNLILLDLNYNKLTDLPETFGQLVKLIYLWLDYNQLTALPDSIGNLVNLFEPHLSNNKLTDLPLSIKSFLQEKNVQFGTQQIDEDVTCDDNNGGGAAANEGGGGVK